jgi:hypothetical protein
MRASFTPPQTNHLEKPYRTDSWYCFVSFLKQIWFKLGVKLIALAMALAMTTEEWFLSPSLKSHLGRN